MNNKKMAESYLAEAEIRLRTAHTALDEGHFAYAVRQSQECVELSLKGALRLAGIEPPKWHDVGIIIRKESRRFPEWFRNNVEKLSLISRQLMREREPSMYGDSELNLPAKDLYTRLDAEEAARSADFVITLCRKLASTKR